eukprot:COSAG01_NODE_2315_length_7925_cov_39.247253_4_plen_70_part_00
MYCYVSKMRSDLTEMENECPCVCPRLPQGGKKNRQGRRRKEDRKGRAMPQGRMRGHAHPCFVETSVLLP